MLTETGSSTATLVETKLQPDHWYENLQPNKRTAAGRNTL